MITIVKMTNKQNQIELAIRSPYENFSPDVPKWEDLVIKAECEVSSMNELDALFTNEELELNQTIIQSLQDDFNNIHKLDKIDISICAGAGILAAIVDILLIGIPKKTSQGLKGGPLSNYVRDWFNQRFPEEEMEKLVTRIRQQQKQYKECITKAMISFILVVWLFPQ